MNCYNLNLDFLDVIQLYTETQSEAATVIKYSWFSLCGSESLLKSGLKRNNNCTLTIIILLPRKRKKTNCN